MHVPFVDLKVQASRLRAEFDAAFSSVVSRAAYTMGPELREFEEAFAAFCDCTHAVGVSSGTDAVKLAQERLTEAQMGVASASCPGETFNRRWHMKPGTIGPSPFGGTDDRVKMNPRAGSPELLEPAGPVDGQADPPR